MEATDLPALRVGKTYTIKVYGEQPFPDAAPHRQIRAESLGDEHTGKYIGTVLRDDTTMVEFELGSLDLKGLDPDGLVKSGRKIGSFHHWLIESITEVTS